ncbi:hypothetical protein AVEN_267455-1 [Araneus ventricosus]|uniref:Uncharacterized protein n=1 Tax=Araneus ventricosus TaxID=182803 RepID=A0A4Y2F4K0_ARAVE|nr:hypothetical protein AVEN_267455-1 [Araneus ventricosus]
MTHLILPSEPRWPSGKVGFEAGRLQVQNPIPLKIRFVCGLTWIKRPPSSVVRKFGEEGATRCRPRHQNYKDCPKIALVLLQIGTLIQSTLVITTAHYKDHSIITTSDKITSCVSLCTLCYFTPGIKTVQCRLIPIQRLNSAATLPCIFPKRTCF